MSDKNNSAQQDFFTKLPESRQHIIALAILFLIPFFLFTAATIGGKEFQRHDITQWRAGAESAYEYEEQVGEQTLWLPNMFIGMPAYVVSVKTQVPHLDRLAGLFKNIYPAFQYWILFSGMYLLLILMGLKPLSALFGSILYGLTSYFPIIIAAGHTSKFVALAFAPWVISGYWYLTRRDNKIAGLLLFSAALALEFRAGHPQITYYFFYLLGLLWVFDTWKAYQQNEIKKWAFTTGILAIGAIIGFLGNAERLLPLQEYSEFSTRGGSAIENTEGLDSGYAFAWSQGIKETFTVLIPNLFGGASPEYWGQKSFTSGPHYFGILSLPFILIALLRQRSKIMYVFFAAGTLGILFSWGGNFRLLNEFAFDYIPFFDKFRAPETWLAFTAFCYAAVAAFGADWFLDFVKQKSADIKKLYMPFGVAAAIFVFLFVQVNSLEYAKPGEVQNIANQIAQQNQVSPENPQVKQRAVQYVNSTLVPEREDKAKSDLLRSVIFFVVAGGILFVVFRGKLSSEIGMLIIVFLATIDMINVDKRYVPEETFVAGNVDPVKTILSQKRPLDTFIQENISDNTSYPYRVLPLLDNAFNNAIPAYFYPSIGGYSGAKLSITQDVIDQGGPLFKGQFGLNTNLLSLLNVKYLTYRRGLNIPGYIVAFESPQGVVYENTAVLPKAFFVDSVITVQEPVMAYEYLNPGKIDFAKTAVVETSESISIKKDSLSSVNVVEYSAPEIKLEVNRSEPGFLVLSEVYYPAGWIAELNGEEVPIYKTNYLLRGLAVPEGNHTITLRFEPSIYSLGLTLSWISLGIQLLLAGFVGFTFFRNRFTGGTN
ncbi:YfhO family protein [Gracilimonas sp.]|uniref:YfhO family protein n=1 Tax=Gracilimonas sp. TaxID=1974203 RepID=UPI0032EF0010